jgi:hypothetical protein
LSARRPPAHILRRQMTRKKLWPAISRALHSRAGAGGLCQSSVRAPQNSYDLCNRAMILTSSGTGRREMASDEHNHLPNSRTPPWGDGYPPARNAGAPLIVLKWKHLLIQGKEFTPSFATVKFGGGPVSQARSKEDTKKPRPCRSRTGAQVEGGNALEGCPPGSGYNCQANLLKGQSPKSLSLRD